MKRTMNQNKRMGREQIFRLRTAAKHLGFSAATRKKIDGTTDGALDFLQAAIKRKKGKVAEQRLSFDDVFGWDVGLRLSYTENSGGIFGDRQPTLAAALIMTGLRIFGWDDGR